MKELQARISSFFKPCSSSTGRKSVDQYLVSGNLGDAKPEKLEQQPEIAITYKRKKTSDKNREIGGEPKNKELDDPASDDGLAKLYRVQSSKLLNKKRKYAQLHLEVGQSNFLLHTCHVCEFKYAPGNEDDEKVHKTFHQNFTLGIYFKGWRKERVMDTCERGRIILVQDGDPSAQQNKVQDVIQMMEMELGDGWILNKLCKVYLFISSHRISGCLVVEPLTKAYRIVSSSIDGACHVTAKRGKSSSSTKLQFGDFCLQREVMKKDSAKTTERGRQCGAILCEEEALPAVCGIRAIWVTPANRRKGIASYLLDAARKTFCTGLILDRAQLAFSQPTSYGTALMSSYTRTSSFLVYTTGNMD